VVVDLDMTPRVVEPDRRIDAIRGTVAIERGPLVQAVETVDLPAGVELEDVRLDRGAAAVAVPRPDVAAGVVGVEVRGRADAERAPGWPYEPPGASAAPEASPVTIRTIPYYAWANRGAGAMRVWIPRDPTGGATASD
jgi:DUF1680 family protein